MQKPNIVLISGFLGSGKTSLLVQLLKTSVENSIKSAVIENEIGEIAIDQRQAEKSGLDIYTLYGGCICCSLKATLMATVNRLMNEYDDIEYIFFEASGVAESSKILESIEQSDYGDLEGLISVFIFDPFRAELYIEKIPDLLKSQLESADIIIVSKIDAASKKDIENTKELLEKYAPQTSVFKMNLQQEISEELLSAVGL